MLSNGRQRCLYTTPHDMKIEYLRQSLAEYDKPDQLATLIAKCPQIEQFKRSAVLVPINVRLVKNDKGNRVQKSFYTLSKRAENLKSFKGKIARLFLSRYSQLSGKQLFNEDDVFNLFFFCIILRLYESSMTYIVDMKPLLYSSRLVLTLISWVGVHFCASNLFSDEKLFLFPGRTFVTH